MNYEAEEQLIESICKEVAEKHGASCSRPIATIDPRLDENGEPIKGSLDPVRHKHFRNVWFDKPNPHRPGMHATSWVLLDLRQVRAQRFPSEAIRVRAEAAIIDINNLLERDALVTA